MNKYEKKLGWIKNYEYDSLDELKEIVELVERATPKKPLNISEQYAFKPLKVGSCPKCNGYVSNDKSLYFHDEKDCGQALDWSEVDENKT